MFGCIELVQLNGFANHSVIRAVSVVLRVWNEKAQLLKPRVTLRTIVSSSIFESPVSKLSGDYSLGTTTVQRKARIRDFSRL